MKISIKSFDVQMEVKQNDVELEVRSPNGSEFLGDCFVTNTGLVWCPGRTNRQKGTKIRWRDLMEIAASDEKCRAALKATKSIS